ncbi:MAG: hypothetical protein ACFFDW_01700 [Candidatus Thorarchaeota archaeon]
MKKNWDLIKVAMIITMVIFSTHSSQEINGKKEENFQYYTNEQYVEEEIIVEWGYSSSLDSSFIYSGGTVFVNMTLLPTSSSNVSLTFVEDERVIWSPLPPNYFILNQGENYSQTLTIVSSSVDNHGSIFCQCMVLQENATATILWGYNVISSSTYKLVLDFEVMVFELIILSIWIYLFRGKIKKHFS